MTTLAELPRAFRHYDQRVQAMLRRLHAEAWRTASMSIAQQTQLVSDLQAPLLSSLEQIVTADAAQTEEAHWLRRVQFLMAVFADDSVSQLQWDARDAWFQASLEYQLFGTRDGASSVFDEMDSLIQSPVSAARGVASSYLLALKLGMRGKFTRAEDLPQLAGYAQGLRRVLQLDEESGRDPRISARAYEHTLLASGRGRIPGTAPMWIAMGIAGLVFAIASLVAWDRSTAAVQEPLHRILNTNPGERG